MANRQNTPTTPGQQHANQVLVGKIVSWPNQESDDDNPPRSAGCGEVVAALEHPLVLVRLIPAADDPEPSYMIVLMIADPALMWFDTQAERDAWFAYIFADHDEEAAIDPDKWTKH